MKAAWIAKRDHLWGKKEYKKGELWEDEIDGPVIQDIDQASLDLWIRENSDWDIIWFDDEKI